MSLSQATDNPNSFNMLQPWDWPLQLLARLQPAVEDFRSLPWNEIVWQQA